MAVTNLLYGLKTPLFAGFIIEVHLKAFRLPAFGPDLSNSQDIPPALMDKL